MRELHESTLVAYVDGELDAETVAEVERALATDPQSRELVRALRESSTVLRSALNEVVHKPVPEALIDTVWASPRAAPRPLRWHERWAVPAAVAASLVALIIGFGGGYFAGGSSNPEGMTGAQIASLRLQTQIERTREETLENELSGTTIRWQDPSGEGSLMVTPVRTYRQEGGGYCREFREEWRIGDRIEARQGLSCRERGGRWEPRYLLIESIGPETQPTHERNGDAPT